MTKVCRVQKVFYCLIRTKEPCVRKFENSWGFANWVVEQVFHLTVVMTADGSLNASEVVMLPLLFKLA